VDIEGFGLGALALVPGVRSVFANQFIPTGVTLAGIKGDGFNRFTLSWEIPGDPPASYGPAAFPIATALIAGAVVIGIGLLVWGVSLIVLKKAGIVGIPALLGWGIAPGGPIPPDRTTVGASDNRIQTGPTCTDPVKCNVLAVPSQPGLLGSIDTILTKVLWGVGIISGVIVLGNLLSIIPRRTR
jgi:multisubunit Na+/H+ antiporter MnhC subunit